MTASAAGIVAVPGLGLDARSFARVSGLPVTVVLLPGMGLPEPCPSVDELAEGLLDRLGTEPVVLVGHSQSCQVVVAAARAGGRHRIVAVVLFGPTTDPRLLSLPILAWRWVRTAVREPPWQVPLVLAQWWHTGPRSMVRLWRTAAPDRIDRRLGSLDVPVTVVRGTRDALCPHDWAARLAAASPLGRLVEIPGAAHMTVQTHPDRVAAIVRETAADR